jgi:hypothetical protein
MLEQLQSLKQQVSREAAELISPPPAARDTAREMGRISPPLSKPSLSEDPFNLPPGHPLHRMSEPETLPSDQDFRKQVVKMAAQGHTLQDIALATGRPWAEVELMMALLKPARDG